MVFIRAQHELPAVTARAGRHRCGRLRGIADLSADCREPAHARRQLDVYHHPRFVEAEVYHVDAQGLAHEAPRAVAADGVGGVHMLCAALCLQHGHNAIGILLDVYHCGAEGDLDVGQLLEAGAQCGFQARLVEHVGPRIACWRSAGWRIARHQHFAFAVDELVALRRAAVCQHRTRYADEVQQAQHFVIDRYGARQFVDGGVFLDGAHMQAERRAKRRQHRADRA